MKTNARKMTVLLLLAIGVNTNADDSSRIDRWQAFQSAAYARMLRDAFTSGRLIPEADGSELDAAIEQIGTDIAACWVAGYIELARTHSLRLDKVFVDTVGRRIDDSHFDREKLDETITPCAHLAWRRSKLKVRSPDPFDFIRDMPPQATKKHAA